MNKKRRVLSCGLHLNDLAIGSTLWDQDITGKMMLKVGGVWDVGGSICPRVQALKYSPYSRVGN